MNKDTQGYSDKEQLDAWIDWKETCELIKCLPDNRAFLNSKAHAKLAQLIIKYNLDFDCVKLTKDDDYAFSIFELYAISHCFTQEDHSYLNKSYKDGIFFNIAQSDDSPLQVINGLFFNYFRSAFKETFFIADKKWREESRTSYIDDKLSEDGLTFENILPSTVNSPDSDVAIYELSTFAKMESRKLIKDLNFEERILMASQFKRLKRSDAFVLDLLETNTSHVTDVLNKNIPKKIKKCLTAYNGEDSDTLALLGKFIFEFLKEDAFSSISSEKKYAEFLSYMERLEMERFNDE